MALPLNSNDDWNFQEQPLAPTAPAAAAPGLLERVPTHHFEASSSSAHHSGGGTIYHTTGPNAYTEPVTMPDSPGTPLLNPRSCMTCRRRKVRCDKQMPCSNCRRALIPCAFPAPGRAPRQHRPKDPNKSAKSTNQREAELAQRLKKLEGIVEELSGQMDDVGVRFPSSANSEAPPGGLSPQSQNATTSSDAGRMDAQRMFGRLVLDDSTGASRYISNGFISKLNDELDAIRGEIQSLTDENDGDSEHEDISQSGSSAATTPYAAGFDHHGFIFGYRSVDIDLHRHHPPPSQTTFLWSVYRQRVDPLIKILHGPTTEAIIMAANKNPQSVSRNQEPLLFAIYFAAVVSLPPEKVQETLGANKDKLTAQYRFLVEQSLARANFLDTSDMNVLQALTLLLIIVKRLDRTKFCWSLGALLIRICKGMGLHRDGSQFHLSPFETEMRRRLWWTLLVLDFYSSDDLGSDRVIEEGSYDTQMPTNINDTDIDRTSSEFPAPRHGKSDTAVGLVTWEVISFSRRLLSWQSSLAARPDDEYSVVAEKERLLQNVYQKVQDKYLEQVNDEDADGLYVASITSRIIMARMALVIYQPMLSQRAEDKVTEELRKRIFIAAIEIIECSARLQNDPRCEPFHWVQKTFKSWHAVAYTLIEACRRPWTALVERGWQAILSAGVDTIEGLKKPDHITADVLPLRKLFTRTKRHREMELARLRANPDEVSRLDRLEHECEIQARFGPPAPAFENIMEQNREKWRKLVMSSGSSPTSSFPTADFPSLADFGSHNGATTWSGPQLRNDASSPHDSRFPSFAAENGGMSTSTAPVNMADATMEYMIDLMTRPSVAMGDLWFVNLNGNSGNKEMDGQMDSQMDAQMDLFSQDAPQYQPVDGEAQRQASWMQLQPPGEGQVSPSYLWSDPLTGTFPMTGYDANGKQADTLGDDFQSR